jgi:hypothetical protein
VKVPFDSSNADYVRQQIRELIRSVSVTLCLIGRSTYTSSWVNWEIRTSAEMGKGLLGVRIHSSSQDIPPTELTNRGAEIVDWNIEAIVAAIERAARRVGY